MTCKSRPKAEGDTGDDTYCGEGKYFMGEVKCPSGCSTTVCCSDNVQQAAKTNFEAKRAAVVDALKSLTAITVAVQLTDSPSNKVTGALKTELETGGNVKITGVKVDADTATEATTEVNKPAIKYYIVSKSTNNALNDQVGVLKLDATAKSRRVEDVRRLAATDYDLTLRPMTDTEATEAMSYQVCGNFTFTTACPADTTADDTAYCGGTTCTDSADGDRQLGACCKAVTKADEGAKTSSSAAFLSAAAALALAFAQ